MSVTCQMSHVKCHIMSFTTKQIKSNTLGTLLNQARISKGLSLKDIEQKTGISITYLQFLEADDFYKFPSATYTHGVLSRYAEVLELDVDDIVNTWKHEYGSDVTQSNTQTVLRSQKRSTLLSFLSRYGARLNRKMSIVILALSLILFYLGVNIKGAVMPPAIRMIHPPDIFITNKAALIVTGVTDPYSEVFINNQLIGTADKEGKFSQEIALLYGLNTIEISAKKKYSRMRTIYSQVVLEE